MTNFLRTSPFAHLVYWDWAHPMAGMASLVDAVKMHMEEGSRQAQEKRKWKLDDLEKRAEYRKAHGLEKEGSEGGFGGWSFRREEPKDKKEEPPVSKET